MIMSFKDAQNYKEYADSTDDLIKKCEDIVNNFIDLKDQWVKVDNIDLLTPVYLKSNQEYLNK